MIVWMSRFLAITSLALLATCARDAVQPAAGQDGQPRAATPVAPPDPAERRFDPGSVAPEGTVAQVRAALAAEDAPRARQLAEGSLASASELTRGRLRWLAADAALAAADPSTAVRHLRQLAASDHPLAPWAAVRAAELFETEEAGLDPAAAAAIVEPFLADDVEGAFRDEARLVHARALASAGRWDEAIPRLRAVIDAAAPTSGAAAASIPLADHLAESEALADREEAIRLYTRVATRGPRATVGVRARQRASALRAALPAERREALAPTMDDRIAEAEAYWRSVLYEEAEQAWGAIAADLADQPEKQCEARLEQGRAMSRRRARREAARHLEAVARDCSDPDVEARARYLAARDYTQFDDVERALALYGALVAEAPTHRLADDAVYRSARLHRGRGDDQAFVDALSSMETRFPTGDMRGEALFELGFHHREKGEHALALGVFERGLQAGVGEDAEDVRGRFAYWRARSLLDLGRREEAIAGFRQLAIDWPLAYYAQQAWRRLEVLDPAVAAGVQAQLTDEDVSESLTFPWRSELETPSFARTLELLRVGAIDSASDELGRMGFLGAGADPDARWLAAALYESAGALPQAARLVRRHLASFRRVAPVGRARALWRLAYPRAFAPLIERHAQERSVPPSFVRAIAREESSFDPNAESWAHAYGLVQIILPTARRIGRGLDVPINSRTLRQPEVNLAVGTRLMANLRAKYAHQPGLVPAAYNAGGGAVDRWLRNRGDGEFDELVERIPYDETRRYTRRVLQSWGIYSWLDERRLPELPLGLGNDVRTEESR